MTAWLVVFALCASQPAHALRAAPTHSLTDRIAVTTPIEKLAHAAEALTEIAEVQDRMERLKKQSKAGTEARACVEQNLGKLDRVETEANTASEALTQALMDENGRVAEREFTRIALSLDAARDLATNAGSCRQERGDDPSTPADESAPTLHLELRNQRSDTRSLWPQTAEQHGSVFPVTN